MEQKMRFGLVLGRLTILNKNGWANYEQLLEVFFQGFKGKNIIHFFKKIEASALNVIIEVFTRPLPMMILKSTSQSLARLGMTVLVNLTLCCVRAASGQDGIPPSPHFFLCQAPVVSLDPAWLLSFTYAWRGHNKVQFISN